MGEQRKQKPRSWANIRYMLKLAFALDPARVALQFFEQLVNYGVWAFYSAVFLRYLLRFIEANEPVSVPLAWIAISVGVQGLLSLLVSWYSSAYRPLSDLRMSSALSRRLFAQAVRADLACYEDEEFFDRYSLAIKEAETRLPEFLTQLSGSVMAGLTALLLIITLGSIDSWLLVLLISPLIGNFVVATWLNNLKYRRDRESTPSRRRIAYVNRVMYQADYAKEIRLSRVMRLLNDHLEQGYAGLFGVLRRYQGRAVTADVLFSVFTFLIPFQGAFLYGAWLASTGRIDIGSFAVLASAAVSTTWMLLGMAQELSKLFKHTLYIENLRSFLDYEPLISDAPDAIPAPRPLQTLELREVSFAYRGQSRPVLQGISFQIRRGEKIAVVGHNGAGKTSLVKLVMRLYDPSEGQVLYNGQPIQHFSLDSYRGLFGAAFQDYRIFAMTVAENVLLRAPRDAADYERARQALAHSGMLEKVLSLPHGMDTMLTREFAADGAQLSGGELQKIAIARAFASDFELAILDEPSSALDPRSEYRLYETIKEVCRDRTVIFISHRLSSATLADRILLFEQGRIVEQGSHQELMERRGAYARMFAMQAEHYLEDNYATIGEPDL